MRSLLLHQNVENLAMVSVKGKNWVKERDATWTSSVEVGNESITPKITIIILTDLLLFRTYSKAPSMSKVEDIGPLGKQRS